ncbi:hypothetical protein KKC17_01080 [Patescibacteria group bacterium]|nr:hypothetical protein [Patescibacteria group bacterium]
MDNLEKSAPNNPGMYDWLLAQQKDSLIDPKQTEKLLKENEEKQDRLKKYRLPTYATTGTHSSLEEAISYIPENKWGVEKFLVRCVPKNNGGLKIQRCRNISLEEVINFVNNLPEGKNNYFVEIREHWEPNYSGTIISDGDGSTVIEQVKGSHANLENQSIATPTINPETGIKKLEINNNRFDLHFVSQGEPNLEEKNIMLEALRYFTPEINRKKLEKLKVYTEYCFSNKYGYRFIDIADNDYWTNLKKKKYSID